jgi:hypothetical protein
MWGVTTLQCFGLSSLKASPSVLFRLIDCSHFHISNAKKSHSVGALSKRGDELGSQHTRATYSALWPNFEVIYILLLQTSLIITISLLLYPTNMCFIVAM